MLVDISVDQGGCFESTRPTTHSDPTFEVNGSLFYCVANMPGAVPHSSTHALVNATLPYVLEIADHGWRDARARDAALAEGVNVVEGSVVYEPVAEAHGMAAVPLAATRCAEPRRSGTASAARRLAASSRHGVDPGAGCSLRQVGGKPDAGTSAGSATGSRRTVRRGISPAHTSRRRRGRPRRRGDLGGSSPSTRRGHAQHGGGGQLLGGRGSCVLPLPGGHLVADGLEADQLVGRVDENLGNSP